MTSPQNQNIQKPSTKGGMRTAEGTDRVKRQPKSVSIAHESQAAFGNKIKTLNNTPQKNKIKIDGESQAQPVRLDGQNSPSSLLPSILLKGGQSTSKTDRSHVLFRKRNYLMQI